MIIPYEMLDAKTLNAVIEEFVTRDGTDFSDIPSRVDDVRRLLKNGEIEVVFDEENESCNIRKKEVTPTST
jgi:uncharacterized protein YheU (UPF0270 family)